MGNAPGAARLRGADAGAGWSGGWDGPDVVDLLPLSALLPDTVHRFRLRDHLDEVPAVTHVRLDIFPDGGRQPAPAAGGGGAAA